MKLHASVVEKIVHIYETYGGHRNETKLRQMITDLDLSEYERQNTGEKILVMTEQLEQEKEQITGRR